MRQVPDEVSEANSIRHERLTVMWLASPVFHYQLNSCEESDTPFRHLENGNDSIKCFSIANLFYRFGKFRPARDYM